MRKFALIAIRKPTSMRIFVNLNDCQRTAYIWILMCFIRYSRLLAYLAPLYPLCRVSTARYHERDKWKAEGLSFTCQIPFLGADITPATNIDTSCCPKDPFNPCDTRQFWSPRYQYITQQTSEMCNKQFLSCRELFESTSTVYKL